MTDEERRKIIQQIVDEPERFKREWLEKAKRENPTMTDAQVRASWEQFADQFGL